MAVIARFGSYYLSVFIEEDHRKMEKGKEQFHFVIFRQKHLLSVIKNSLKEFQNAKLWRNIVWRNLVALR